MFPEKSQSGYILSSSSDAADDGAGLWKSSEFCKKLLTILPNTVGVGTSSCDCGEPSVRFI
jgi:hypothetical protein